MADTNFRAVVVGGGPAGLMAAHMFYRAGIDFILLEQRESIVAPQGAGIVIFPHNLRVLDQLGLLERVRAISLKIHRANIVTRTGHHYNTLTTDKWTAENHGTGWLFLHRPRLFQLLYDSLPDHIRQRLQPNKRVVNIKILETGIEVRCSDGTIEQGSIVIGADGVHSQVRNQMHELASEAKKGTTWNDKEPFTITYQCMFGNTKQTIPELKAGTEWDMHSTDVASQLFVGEDKAWFLWYQKLKHPDKERRKYDQEDQDHFVDKVADMYITPTLKFRDVYEVREWSMLSDLHEGVIKSFFWKRAVMVGDALNKQTPNMGFGWNSGLQDLVVLTNGLRRLLHSKNGKTISTRDVEEVFKKYQSLRYDDSVDCKEAAAVTTRTHTWATWKAWLMDRYILPWTRGTRGLFRQGTGPLISRGHVLEFLEEANRPSGLIPWVRNRNDEALEVYQQGKAATNPVD